MSNAYATLGDLKRSGSLSIAGSSHDPRLMQMIVAASRGVDELCNRHFYEMEAARKYDGDGTTELFIDDLISIDTSGLKTDDNKDRTFETTWAVTDYLLLPSNADPATRSNGRSRPYWKLEVDPAGNEDVFTLGRQTVQITGKFGYWRHLRRALETMFENPTISATDTELTTQARTGIDVGHTILINDEQMYVKEFSGNDLEVERGVNGTTAAIHDFQDVIDVYEYPPQIVDATIIQASRLWRRREAAFANAVAFPDGTTQLFTGLDPDVSMLLKPFVRFAF